MSGSHMKHLVLVATIVAALQGCTTPGISNADAQFRRLCAADAGIKVYETVRLPPDRFDESGNPYIPYRLEQPDSEFYFDIRMTYLYRYPTVIKTTHKIVRRSDGKILGTSISYARGGGGDITDFRSTLVCPEISKDMPRLESLVFIKGH